jgi:Lrp/AsnC family transcriptional regulator, leucine-responsive regulatory protein
MAIRLDEIDEKILRELQEHGCVPNVELASRVGLSAAPCLRRVRALEEAGVIRKYVALLDPEKVGVGVTVFVHITVDLTEDRQLDLFERTIVKSPEVVDCYLMTGEPDYLLRIVVPDVASYERFLRQALRPLTSIASIRSSFALKRVKSSTALPLQPGHVGRSDLEDRSAPAAG